MASKVELHRIYICGLQPYVEPDDLKFQFDAFGEIHYFHFHADEGYTLISYTNQRDAILAIANGNNMIIGGYPIQVQWARGYPRNRDTRYKDYSFDSIYYECCTSNCIVYCSGGVGGPNSKNLLQSIFGPFGIIQEIYIKINKFHTDNAMIRFHRKEDATLAICTIDGTQVDGRTVSCTWSNRPISHFLASGWHSIGGYQVSFQPAFLPPAFNPSSASSTAFRTPAAAPSSTPDLTFRTPAISSSTPNSTLRTPAVSSSTTVRSPVTSETLSSFSSNISRFQEIQEQLAKLLQDSTSSDEEYDDNFDTVLDQTGPNNCTVYCEGLNFLITNETLKKTFSPFGIIEEIDLYVNRSDYAFIRFNTKVAATLAICSINNTKINGCLVKCTWSNRQDDQTRVQIATVDYLEVSEPVTTSTQLCPPATCLPSATSAASSLSSSAAASALLPKIDQSSKSKKTKEGNTDIVCKICMDKELGMVFLPCGHLICCSKCAQKINVCPMCRKPITSKVRTYLS